MRKTPISSDELYTLDEAEARTKRKKATWRRDILKKKIPYVKIGRQVRIPKEVIDRMIADGYRPAVAPKR